MIIITVTVVGLLNICAYVLVRINYLEFGIELHNGKQEQHILYQSILLCIPRFL